jgi:oxygen-independent coproporphyrinogen-3 oxidase
MSLSIYIHIPFCLTKCGYCDFSSVSIETIPEDDYTDCVIKEIRSVTGKLYDEKVPVSTIYFGGGTPSLFSVKNIDRIISAVCDHYDVSDSAEITLEVNPKTAGYDKLKGFKDTGVNRLSIGAQSFDDSLLKILGRVHDRADAIIAYEDARRAGFDNVNLDLIFGIPTEDDTMLAADLKTITNLNPEHISAYILTLERATPMYGKIASGELIEPDDDRAAGMFKTVERYLTENSYCHYEVSAYAKAGKESAHNLNYWRYGEYLSFGAAAHSFIKKNDKAKALFNTDHDCLRFLNVKSHEDYMKKITGEGQAVGRVESLTEEMRMNEFLMMGMRLLEGISLSDFKHEFGSDLADLFKRGISLLNERGLAGIKNNRLKLSEKGVLLSNEVLITLIH